MLLLQGITYIRSRLRLLHIYKPLLFMLQKCPLQKCPTVTKVPYVMLQKCPMLHKCPMQCCKSALMLQIALFDVAKVPFNLSFSLSL